MKRIRRVLNQPEPRRSVFAPLIATGAIILAITLASHAPMLAQAQQTPYTKWVNEDVTYLISEWERAQFNLLRTDQERERFIERFWLRRDPTPGTPENEMKEEHYRRIAYANSRYAAPGIVGWKSDRGRIYIQFGPPDEIESHPNGGVYLFLPNQSTPYPFEAWRYRHIEDVGDNVDIWFVDLNKSGDFTIVTGR